ncbi:MAG: hypothetical protein ACLTV6_00335 [Christensenellales bacterium]
MRQSSGWRSEQKRGRDKRFAAYAQFDRQLNEASRRYYDQNESDISDDEWDAMAELRKLEEKTGERMADSRPGASAAR